MPATHYSIMKDGEHVINKTMQIKTTGRQAIKIQGACIHISGEKEIIENISKAYIQDGEFKGVVENETLKLSNSGDLSNDTWYEVAEIYDGDRTICIRNLWNHPVVKRSSALREYDIQEGDFIKIEHKKIKQIVRTGR